MLCRTASDLYWVSRHMERAENTARLLDVTQRIAMLPERFDRGKAQAAPWRRALDALGIAEAFAREHGGIEPRAVVDHLLLAPGNPASVYSCFRDARENARAQRVAITAEMYEDLNSTWFETRGLDQARMRRDGLSNVLEWVKRRSSSFRGVTIGTLGRGEGYHFMQLGVFVERADWAIRLLDVVGSDTDADADVEARAVIDYFRWSALLQALSAFETYRRHYRDSVNPASVAELMLLKQDNPRSLLTCAAALHDVLRTLAGNEGAEVVRQAGALSAQARYARIDEVLASGLEPWLQDTMRRLDRLGGEIHRQFMSASDLAVRPSPAQAWQPAAAQQ